MDGGAQVLLVDDEAALLELTQTYLHRIDDSLETHAETDPEDALDYVDANDVDCVVSDYDMPEMDGLELFEAVRDVEADLPFVLFTGRGSEEVASEALSAGVTDYLQKESGQEQYEVLANRVRNAISRYRAEQTAVATSRRLQRVVERISDAFFSVDPDWTIDFANDQAAEYIGEPREQLVGRDLRSLVPEEAAPKSYALYRRALAVQDSLVHEVESTVHPGTWIEERVYPAENGLSVYFRDVTDRVETEQELRETNQKITALHRVADELVECDAETEIFDRTIEAAEEIIELDRCAIDKVEADHLVPQSVSQGLVSDDVYHETPVDDPDSLGAETYRTGESVLVHDASSSDATREDLSYRSVLSAAVGDHGVFQAVNSEPDAFTSRDLELVELLLSHVAAELSRFDSTPH